MNKKARTRLIVATGVIVVAFVVGVVYLVSQQGAYYRQVSELVAGDYDGKNVQVGGRVLDGTISRDDAGVHFTIQDLQRRRRTPSRSTTAARCRTRSRPASTWSSSASTRLREGLIAADELQTKCPSKYEGQGTTPTAPAAVQ